MRELPCFVPELELVALMGFAVARKLLRRDTQLLRFPVSQPLSTCRSPLHTTSNALLLTGMTGPGPDFNSNGHDLVRVDRCVIDFLFCNAEPALDSSPPTIPIQT